MLICRERMLITGEQTDGYANDVTDEQTGGQSDERTNERRNGRTKINSYKKIEIYKFNKYLLEITLFFI